MIVKHPRINFISGLVRYRTPLSEILPKYANLSGKPQLNSPVLCPELGLLSKISLQKTGGFMGIIFLALLFPLGGGRLPPARNGAVGLS